MANSKLEIKQRETYPRCRVNQGFFQSLIEDRDIRTNGCPGLFSYIVLCSFATFSKQYLRLEGISYAVDPGECVCMVEELTEALRLRTRSQTLDVLWAMRNRGLIQYTLLDRGELVKFKITGWHRCNNVQYGDCPNQKENGFFFVPAATAVELIGSVKCSEMDILLDLWFSAVYRDERIRGSYSGPVVYFRNDFNTPLVTYDELAQRWGLSCSAVRRILRKFEEVGYISRRSSLRCSEMVIYLADELSNIFQASDILLDKDELPMAMCVEFSLPEDDWPKIRDKLAQKVFHLLALQGIGCAECHKCTHKLYFLPKRVQKHGDSDLSTGFRLEIQCEGKNTLYSFDLFIVPCENQ